MGTTVTIASVRVEQRRAGQWQELAFTPPSSELQAAIEAALAGLGR